MANLVEYVKTVWENGKTALNAARMNNMEKGISDCATQINKLGYSVYRSSISTVKFSYNSSNGHCDISCPQSNLTFYFSRGGIGVWDEATLETVWFQKFDK